MKDSHDDEAVDRLLRARLRETTPEFEKRFDALRRSLAAEELQRRWFARPLVWTGAIAGIAAAAMVAMLLVTPDRSWPDEGREVAAYGELIMLDDTLHNALVLADAETLEAILLMPVNGEVGS